MGIEEEIIYDTKEKTIKYLEDAQSMLRIAFIELHKIAYAEEKGILGNIYKDITRLIEEIATKKEK